MRKLASVQRILNIRPIEGADKIEVVEVLGWSVVTKKDEFKAGDYCIFFEIDSFLNADDPRYSSFEDRFINWGNKRGMRLKTVRLRKQLSQGLVLKLSEFPEVVDPVEGMDVTELLKIEKWESEEEQKGNNGRGNQAGVFPDFLPKTEQSRIQNLGEELLRDDTYEVSIKVDGSSLSVIQLMRGCFYYEREWEKIEKKVKRNKIHKFFRKMAFELGLLKKPDYIHMVCSRNVNLKIEDGGHFVDYVKKHKIFEKMQLVSGSYAIQGELIGPSIQANYEKVDENQFLIYDVFSIRAQQYLNPWYARQRAEVIGIDYVPVLHEKFSLDTSLDLRALKDGILGMAEGPGMNKGVKREGLVFKSNSDPDFSFKAISNSYLLKKDKK